MKKYLVVAGSVKSKEDGQIHYLHCADLVKLYGVNYHECIFIPYAGASKSLRESLKRHYDKGLIRLEPREDGNYTLPESTNFEQNKYPESS